MRGNILTEMTPRLLETVLREAAARAADSGGGPLPDADLLRRYAVERDEAAFNALVARHGRVVWSVCRQSLPGEADAEDAFQATFLALARSAGSIHSSLPGWLHGVAVKICTQARRTFARQHQRDTHAASKESERPVPESAWDGLLAEVHAEVERLPSALREAFVLVDLHGVSQAEAADQLGWKAGTLTGRLSQARQLLLERLTARGLAPAAALVGVGVGAITVTAHVPHHLIATVCAFAKAGTIIPASVSSLAAAATEGSFMLKIKVLAAGIMISTATMLTVVSAQPPAGEAPKTPPSAIGKRGGGAAPIRGGGDVAPEPVQPPGLGRPGAGGMAPPGAGAGMAPGGMPGMSGGGSGGFGGVMLSRPGFEYKVVRINAGAGPVEKMLNDLGNDNWELVTITSDQLGYFKRRKDNVGGVGGPMGGFGSMMGAPGGGGMGFGGDAGGGGGMLGGAFGGRGGQGGPGGSGGPPGSGNLPPAGPPEGGSPDGGGMAPRVGGPVGNLGGARGGMIGGSLSGGNRAARAVLTAIETPNLEPKKVATSIEQLFGERGIHAVEAPDGNGIVITGTGRANDVEEVKKFVAEYVEKAQRKQDEQKKKDDAFQKNCVAMRRCKET